MSEQNKIPCAVAQDLMPLVIDGAASEQSRQAVAQHVAACSACSQIYREMQSAAPAPVAQGKVEQGFRQAVKRPAQAFSCLENRRAVPGAGGGHLPGHGRRQARAFAGLCARMCPSPGRRICSWCAQHRARCCCSLPPRRSTSSTMAGDP